MENKKTAMSSLIEKILRMPESNIIGFLKIIGPVYIELEKKQMIEFANKVLYNAECSFTGTAYLEKDIDEIYNETYGK